MNECTAWCQRNFAHSRLLLQRGRQVMGEASVESRVAKGSCAEIGKQTLTLTAVEQGLGDNCEFWTDGVL